MSIVFFFHTVGMIQKRQTRAGFGTRVKKSEDIARSIAEFLVNIADMKNPDIDNFHEAIYQSIQTYV